MFFMYSASAADAATVNPKGIKTLLANGLITFVTKCNPTKHNFQMLKQKVYLFLENLVQLNDLNLHSVLIILVLIDIYSRLLFF